MFTTESKYKGQKTLIEPFIECFQKFNSNVGSVINEADTGGWPALMQALSHYSYHISGGKYALCDLQGGIWPDGGGVVLTDPVILSRTREFGVTDLGPEGISTFFARHKCNKFCKSEWTKPKETQIHFKPSLGTTMVPGMRA